jgi:hypothetical protein
MSKKTENQLNRENWKNQPMKKNWLNWLKYLKKYSIWFGFISLKPKNRTESKKIKKPNQTEIKLIRKS